MVQTRALVTVCFVFTNVSGVLQDVSNQTRHEGVFFYIQKGEEYKELLGNCQQSTWLEVNNLSYRPQTIYFTSQGTCKFYL